MRHVRHAVAAIAIAASLAAGAVQAQDADDESRPANSDDEIIVTAQKTGAQALHQVPMAIQAFDGEALKERNITNITDLASSIPGAVESQRQSSASRSFAIRGAGGGAANGDSPVGYYLDDVPFVVPNFGIAPPVQFLDIDRVEVLRGPQGTLYGQGSAGGVFIFRTRDPDLNDIDFAAEATVGSTRLASGLNYAVAAAVSVPIVKDVLAVRVSGGHSREQGWADAYYGAFDGTPDEEDVNTVKNDDIRVVALLKPADNVSLRAQYWHFKPRQNFLGGLASIDPPYYADTAGQPSFGNGDFTLYSLTAAADFDDFSITSATSYMEGNFGIYIPLAPSGFFSSQFFPENFSQEVRINSTGAGPLRWVLGGQYQDGRGPQENTLENPFISINADNNTITKNSAIFGEVSYDLMDGKLVPLVGLRYYHDERTFEDATSSLPTNNLTMFATASTGFRAGIVQSQAQSAALEADGIPAPVQLEPEELTNYEIGLKWRSPDRNINVGLNGYIIKLTNAQTSVNSSTPGVGGFTNFGDATTRGIDFELRWATPLAGLSLGAVGNINDGQFDYVDPEVQAALPYVREGARLFNTAKYNYRLDASYLGSLTENLDLFGNLGFTRRGNRLQANGTVTDAYSLVNATLGLRRGPYEVALIGDNLLDERGPTIRFGTDPNSGSGPNPRTVSVRFRVNFQ
jgi:iron complex outermembrane recepter protein